MPGGPWCELFLILYRTPFTTELNKTDADYPKPCHCCKTFGYFDSSRRFMCCDFRKKQRLIITKYCSGPLCWNSDRSLFPHSGPQSCQLTYYAKLRPLTVCIHKEGSHLWKVLYIIFVKKKSSMMYT